MQDAYAKSKRPFVIIIDEWDCIFREYKTDKKAQEQYLDFLRDLMKDKWYIHLAYMTGILPVKKYGTHSALNMFDEFTMIEPGPLASYVGFTENEVESLCRKYAIEMEEVKSWYDGYSFEGEPFCLQPAFRSQLYALWQDWKLLEPDRNFRTEDDARSAPSFLIFLLFSNQNLFPAKGKPVLAYALLGNSLCDKGRIIFLCFNLAKRILNSIGKLFFLCLLHFKFHNDSIIYDSIICDSIICD